jgi:hypothetical protein
MTRISFPQLAVLMGPVALLAGAVDPLEGSLIIVAGALLDVAGVRLGGRPEPGRVRTLALAVVLAALAGLGFLLFRHHATVLLIPLGLVLLGAGMLEWGLRRGAPADKTCVYGSTGLIVFGVAALWVLSAFGGFGEGALSWWWALLCLPYPLGWLRHLYSVGRWIGEGEA